jgi:uncharacterized protein (DUF2147 family)
MKSHPHNARIFLLLVGIVLVHSLSAGQHAVGESERIVGTWITADEKAHIEIFQKGDAYCGKIIWVKDSVKNGQPAVDDKNPDPKLNRQPILGLELMYGFIYDGDDVWTGGRVYDPESGDEYRGKLHLTDSTTLELRGYVMIPLFGRTETWRRKE